MLKKRELINQKQIEYANKKSRPSLAKSKLVAVPFKNISEDKKAWKLIKKAGCEDLTEGQAAISKKHCNFFVNKGNAKSSDIEKLIQKVKKQVYEKTKINLELEIKIIGD